MHWQQPEEKSSFLPAPSYTVDPNDFWRLMDGSMMEKCCGPRSGKYAASSTLVY
jgi:hypothetical protein